MPVATEYLKEFVVAASLVIMTVAALATTTAPNDTGREPAALVSVDRTNKGGRLPYSSISKTHANSSLVTTTPQATPQQLPLGCDSAFSSLADPTRPNIYKRCTT